MASTTRSRRATHLVPQHLSSLERLILAQAVYELGADAWPAVAKLLSEHPLILQPPSSFSPESCQAAYKHLMKEANLESSAPDFLPRHGKNNLKLAQKHYQSRIFELRELIVAEEGKFKAIVAEIDAIRSGAWDEQIRETLGISEDEKRPPPVQVADVPETEPASGAQTVEPTAVREVTAAAEQKGLPPENQPASEDVQLVPDGEDDIHPELSNLPASPGEQTVIDLTEEPDDEIEASEKQDNLSEAAESEPEHGILDTLPESLEDREEPPEGTGEVSGAPAQLSEENAATPVPEPDQEDKDEDIVMDEGTPEPERDQEEWPDMSHRDSKRKASELEGVSETERDKKRAREESQISQADEDEDAAPSPGPSRRRGARPAHEVTPATKKFQNVIIMLHSQISQHRNGNIFHNPIKNSEAPDYREIVRRPMDLKTIKMRIKDGAISNSAQFQRDVYLMFANSMMYNRPKSDIYNMAEEMMLVSEQQINEFLQTEGIIRGGHRL